MIYSNTIQVLNESACRMSQENLYEFSHCKGGFSFYTIRADKSTDEDMEFIEDTLTRQGIPCVIYPDRLGDNLIAIKFSTEGDLLTKKTPYGNVLSYHSELTDIGLSTDNHDIEIMNHIQMWEGQIRKGNRFSLKQFIKPDEE